MFGNKEIPVYLFTGFLESGKTTCIQEVIEEGNFADGAKTLLILCEEGEHEIDDQLLMQNRISCVVMEEEEELTEDACKKLQEKYRPSRVVIEYNGMWDMERLFGEGLPENWIVVQTFTTVNAQTYQVYSSNMKPLLMAHFQMSDLVIFNRCGDGLDKPAARRSVKAINRRAQVLFESEDGSVESNIDEELPYDINASEITLEDDDFGLWYLDISEHPEKYAGKTMIFKGQVYRNRTFPGDAFVPSRKAMTCCADDIARIGFMCHDAKASEYATDSWVKVTVKVKTQKSRKHEGDYPVLYADKIEPADPPAEEIVYFG
jgi:uncharacterized repeat protein (TIGR03943 family)